DTMETVGRDLCCVPDADLWALRATNRKLLVDYARERMARELVATGAAREQVASMQRWLDPDALTLGFARRFVTYKRPNLLLHARERLLRLLSDAARRVQLVIAGKRGSPWYPKRSVAGPLGERAERRGRSLGGATELVRAAVFCAT